MSGICGQFNLDSAPVAAADLRSMTSMLRQRGPERTEIWQGKHCGLGHTLLATTPELQYEQQPFVHAETGCAITADVRLDNRSELLAALALDERRDSLGDAELILRSYLEWGDDCVGRLLGDFAFSIWDPRQQKLFCARDHFGIRPFYYHHMSGKRFVFASDARAILMLPQVPYAINQGRVADFLVPQLEWIDYTSTFYEAVYRLPPGHTLTVTPTAIRLAEYWKPEPVKEFGSMSDDDIAAGFLEVFSEAVRTRLRVPEKAVGSMLSGGMDSGSVVAVAKEILSAEGRGPLSTYSAAHDRDSDCEESRAIYSSLNMPSLSPTLIHPDVQMSQFESLVSNIEEPFDSKFTLLKAIYLAAHEQGKRVILDGAGGDVILGCGTYIIRLLRQGQLRLAVSEIAAESRIWEEKSSIPAMLHYGRSAILPQFIKKSFQRVARRSRTRDAISESLISRDFAHTVHISDRFERMRQTFPDIWTPDYFTERCNAIRPNMTGGRERYARLAASFGVEARDPFMDKRVVDFCSGLPGRFRMKRGWPKVILRELMAGRLPDDVRWSRRKPHIGWQFNESIAKQALASGEISLSALRQETDYCIDSKALEIAWKEFRGGGDADPIHTVYVLSSWLRENATRPVVLD